MANLLGSFNIQASQTGSVNSDSIAVANAIAVSVATTTKDLLIPSIDMKAPRNNPIFTGNVQGITASMVTALDKVGAPSTVQTELGKINNVTAQDVKSNGIPGLSLVSTVQADINKIRDDIYNQGQTSGTHTTDIADNTRKIKDNSDDITDLTRTVNDKVNKNNPAFTGPVQLDDGPILEATNSLQFNNAPFYLNAKSGTAVTDA